MDRLRKESLGAPVDVELLEVLAHGLQRMVAEYRLPDEKLVEASVRYFCWTGDSESDVEPGGLHDDAEVFNAVAVAIGRDDLTVQIPGLET